MVIIGSSAQLSKVDSIIISTDRKPLEEVQSFLYLGIYYRTDILWKSNVDIARLRNKTRLALPVSSRRELGRDQNIKWKVGDKSGTPKRDFQFLTIKISHSIENLAFDTLLFWHLD